MTVALAACDDEIQAAVVHGDEKPFKQGTAKAWIGTFVAATFTYFVIRLTRAAAVPAEVLGPSCPGVIVTDRETGDHLLNGRRQFGGAHLKRDFQNRLDAGGDGQNIIGERLRASLKKRFQLGQRSRAGRIRHATLRKRIERDCWSQIDNTLEDGQRCSHAPTVSRCHNLLAHFDQLWRFTEIEGIEPTNNRVERALRHARAPPEAWSLTQTLPQRRRQPLR